MSYVMLQEALVYLCFQKVKNTPLKPYLAINILKYKYEQEVAGDYYPQHLVPSYVAIPLGKYGFNNPEFMEVEEEMLLDYETMQIAFEGSNDMSKEAYEDIKLWLEEYFEEINNSSDFKLVAWCQEQEEWQKLHRNLGKEHFKAGEMT